MSKRISALLAGTCLVALCTVPGDLVAQIPDRGSGSGIGHNRFVGRITLMPPGGQGFWRIASRQISTDHGTQIFSQRGQLQVGNCAAVEMLGERVLSIEGLESDDC